MATDLSYIEFVCEYLKGYDYRYKKMFGEYMIYINDKPILLVCDNTVFVKMHESIKDYTQNLDTGYPYNGAKEHYILDIEDRELSHKIIDILELNTKEKKK
ncbi:Regulator of competence-specific genes [Alteracholeplasma palmae J233]|uniref:Regulator of competence-specific genes n=1 Tax=Alteracholeplasma palmae (strain ATCC 49389 / J233) TaxID=1318466 RepID=U4KNP0_ALTPJ|nr:TfoX/Sxy family protein [Alteracholeplasma palmae]CCV63815.1 Regulator of competence-specific genes [Alteracholeplasma palmae J233]